MIRRNKPKGVGVFLASIYKFYDVVRENIWV